MGESFRRQIDSTRNSLRNEYQSIVNPNTSKKFKIHKNVNAELFHDIFEIVQNYLPNGDCVDVHNLKSSEWSTGYEDCNCYLTEDGLSGFAITPSGDLISVFSLSKEGGFLKSIKDFVKSEGAKTLDCYQSEAQPLATIYEKTLGFKTASILDFNYDILLNDRGKEYADYFVKTYGEAPVHFMVNTDENVVAKHFIKDQYDNAYDYQQESVSKKSTNEVVSYRKFKISKRGFKEFYNYQIENNLDFSPSSKMPNDFSINEAKFSKWFQDNVIIGKHGGVYVDTKYVYDISVNSTDKMASIDGAMKIEEYNKRLEEFKNAKQSRITIDREYSALGRARRDNAISIDKYRKEISEETTRNTRTSEDSQNTRGSKEGTLQEEVNSNSNKNSKSKSSSSTNSNNQKIKIIYC